MVPSIARQSVVIKCLRKRSVLLGNYEFYYLAGLMKKLYNLDISEEMEPKPLFDVISETLDSMKPSNDNEEYLIHLVRFYRPLEEYDDQMKLLFRWGATEENMWQVNTEQHL